MSTSRAAPIHHLKLMAFDHRHSLERSLLGLSAPPTPEETEFIRTLKSLIYTGFRLALRTGAERAGAGILVDEHYGADVARSALEDGPLLALSVERSGQDEFDFEYGDTFGAHIDTFDPAFIKVQVRYNPEGESELNARQTERLARLSGWLQERGRRFLCELRLPTSPTEQLEVLEGSTDRYESEVRVAHLVRAMHELQTGGVNPDVWMVEGLERPADCLRVARQARAGERESVACVMRDGPTTWERLERCLNVAGTTPGFIGFAIGRALWWEPVRALHHGQLTAAEAAQRICDNYQRAQITWNRASLLSPYQEAAAPN